MNDHDGHTVNIFNEQSLRVDIVRTWGEHGAHVAVLDHLLATVARLRTAADPLADAVLRRLDDLRSIKNSRHGLTAEGLHLLSHIEDFEALAVALRAVLDEATDR